MSCQRRKKKKKKKGERYLEPVAFNLVLEVLRPLAREGVDLGTFRVVHKSRDLVVSSTEKGALLEGELCVLAGCVVVNLHLAIVLQRAVVREDITHARGDLVPAEVVASGLQPNVDHALVGYLH